MKTPISTQDQRATDQNNDGARRHFIRKWFDRKWQAFARTGLGSLLLALPALAQASVSDDAYLDVDTMANVRSVQTLGDGSVQLTLLDGRKVIVQAEEVRILDADQILISGDAAAEIAQLAADTAGGGDGGGGGLSGVGGAGAALAGLGVVGAAGGGGGGSGSAAPAPPPLTLSDVTTTGLSNTSTGTTVPAGTENVIVTIGSLQKTVTPDQDGNWNLTLTQAEAAALPQGATTIEVVYENAAGKVLFSETVTYTIDTQPPTLTLDTIAGDAIVNAAEAGSDLNITGTTNAEDGQTVTVTLNGQAYTGTANGGTWSVTVPAAALTALGDGANLTVTADVTDAAGNPAAQASSALSTDFTAPTMTLAALPHGEVMNAAEQGTDLTVTGTSDAPDGTQVAVSLARSDGTVDASGTATVTGGAWSLTIPAASLAALQDGQSYTARADVTDAAGNVGSATSSFATDFSAPTLTLNALSVGGVLDAIERNSDLAVSGTTNAEDGQTVTVTFNGQNYTATASGGAWSVTIPQADLAALSDTTDYTLTANVSDAAGNAATQVSAGLSTDFRPILTMNDVGSNDAVVLSTAKASGLTVSGSSAELAAGQSVDVTLNGTLVGTATIASDGSWSLAVPASNFSAISAGTDLSFEASASVAGGRDPLPASDTAVAYDAGAYVIAETGRSGSTVTFSMYADPGRDVSGGLAVTAQMTFESNVVTFDAGSVNANNAFSLFLANPADASTVNFAGAATSFGDLSAPLVTFEMTVQDASKPIVLKLTTPDGGPTTLQFGTDGADTLVAEDVSNVIQGGGGNDSIDVSEGGRHVVVFEADPSANGTDTVTGFTLGPAAQITDALTFSGLDVSSLRGAGTGVETLASGGTIGTDTGVVGFTTAVSDLNADTLADAAETLVGTEAGDVFYFMASDGSNAALARVTFSDADTATAEVMGTFNGLGDLSTLSADNILHTDPTGAAA